VPQCCCLTANLPLSTLANRVDKSTNTCLRLWWTSLTANPFPTPCVYSQDVLGHSNTRAFMSHCGIHSVYEAAYHGVPLVGVPFMFEQV
jgi:hypothetical protein